MTFPVTFAVTSRAHSCPMTAINTNTPHPSRTGPALPRAEGERLVLTVAEAGELLGISRAFAYELVARGELPVIRLGRRRLVPKRALLALIDVDVEQTDIGTAREIGSPVRTSNDR